jgi:hypothetical protein
MFQQWIPFKKYLVTTYKTAVFYNHKNKIMTLYLNKNLIPPKEARSLPCKWRENILFDAIDEMQQKELLMFS